MIGDTHLLDLGSARCPNPVKQKILELETGYGYEFTLVDDVIHYQCRAESPDLAEVKPRLDFIRRHRDLAISYLCSRSDPVRSDVLFWVAAEKAALSARRHASLGHPALARREWARFARLFAAFARLSAAPDPTIPWPAWIRSFSAPTASAGDCVDASVVPPLPAPAASAGVVPKHSLPLV